MMNPPADGRPSRDTNATCQLAAQSPSQGSYDVSCDTVMGRILLIGRGGELPAMLSAASSALREHDFERCAGNVEALQHLRARAADVVVTDPSTAIAEDLALAREIARVRPGVRLIAVSRAGGEPRGADRGPARGGLRLLHDAGRSVRAE